MMKVARFGLVSYRNELIVVGSVFMIILLLPILAVFTIANAGVAVVSDALVSVNVRTKVVEIHNPSGALVSTIPISSTWPVGGKVSFDFGATGSIWQDRHTGIDIADPQGKIGRPVTVFMEGKTSKVVNVDNEYGKYVFVDHGNQIVSQYWHLDSANTVVGAEVKPGDVIGYEGNTGRSTGPHLHFEVQVYGIPTNPRLFIEGNPPPGI